MPKLSAEHRPVACAPSGYFVHCRCGSGVQLRWVHRPGGPCSRPLCAKIPTKRRQRCPSNSRRLITSSLVIATCALVTGCQHGPNPADTVRNAYGWYLRELKSGVNPLEQKRTELKQFVTDNFLASIDNMRSELEASSFMDARSFDAKLSIEKVTSDRRAATVRVGLSGRLSGQHALNVYLVKVDGTWKVDDVKLLEQLSLAEKSERAS